MLDDRFTELRGVPLSYDGLGAYLMAQSEEEESPRGAEKWMAQFTRAEICPECHGGRPEQGSPALLHRREEYR